LATCQPTFPAGPSSADEASARELDCEVFYRRCVQAIDPDQEIGDSIAIVSPAT
jgi:hypothetical protein